MKDKTICKKVDGVVADDNSSLDNTKHMYDFVVDASAKEIADYCKQKCQDEKFCRDFAQQILDVEKKMPGYISLFLSKKKQISSTLAYFSDLCSKTISKKTNPYNGFLFKTLLFEIRCGYNNSKSIKKLWSIDKTLCIEACLRNREIAEFLVAHLPTEKTDAERCFA